MARILVFDPYIHALGGGERLVFELAAALSADNDVELAGPRPPEADALAALGFDPRQITRLATRDVTAASARYDVLVYLTLGLPVRSRARRSFLIVQFPSRPISRGPRRFEQLRRLSRYECIVYSEFVAEWLERRWRRSSLVVSPPVERRPFTSEKSPLILGVGRFFVGGHTKRQDVLVDAFTRLDLPSPWRLVLAGGLSPAPENVEFVERLRADGAGHRVEVLTNVDAATLDRLYSEASIFWHATGFGRPAASPELAEHFGISTVEAMSAGCVPVVFDDGGQREIVDETCGARWTTIDELCQVTRRLVADPGIRSLLGTAARARSERFDAARFREEMLRLIQP